MHVVRGYRRWSPGPQGCVATIGNFDGVHLGHQAVVRELAARAADMGCPSVLMTFEPQPQEYFVGLDAPARLTRLREKLVALRSLPIDRVLLQSFDAQFAALPAAAFIRDILVDALAVRYLVVGDDFRFGRGREGDFALLQAAGETHGFTVSGLPTFVLDGHRVSSTRVRDALQQGDFDAAARLLGRRYTLIGRVIAGQQRGRTIGFPTANIALQRASSPLRGVFAVRALDVDGRPVDGVANVGTRPTVDGGERLLLEVHLFDFAADLYGRCLEIEFSKKLRDEQRFASFDALREQIERDAQQARAFFNNRADGR